jgi:prepilin peptidase CpaA
MLGALAAAHLAIAALSDVRTRSIPDWVPSMVAVLGVVSLALGGFAAGPIAVAAALCLLGFAAFALGVMGGGDVKLLAAVGLWIPPAALHDFFTVMALTGAVLALVVVARRRLLAAVTGAAVAEPASVPYGAAIAAGAGYVLFAPV